MLTPNFQHPRLIFNIYGDTTSRQETFSNQAYCICGKDRGRRGGGRVRVRNKRKVWRRIRERARKKGKSKEGEETKGRRVRERGRGQWKE